MKTHTAMIIFIFGLIVTGFGVGGVETSIDNLELIQCTVIAALGLALMFAGTVALNVSEYYDNQRG